MKRILIFILNIYKKTFSLALKGLLGDACRFEPTCSEYAMQAIDKHGVFRGTILSVRRIGKCNPLGPHGYDPVP